MSSKSKWINNFLTFFDPNEKYETTLKLAPIQFLEDFIGSYTVLPAYNALESGCIWCKRIVSAHSTVALAANFNGGAATLALTADSEEQAAVLYMADQLLFDILYSPIFEAKVRFNVIPTTSTAAAKLWLGLHGPYSTAGSAFRCGFYMTGSGLLYCGCDDNTTDNYVSTGITISSTTTWYTLKIDCTSRADIGFYVDGAQVCADSTFTDASTAYTETIRQPFFMLYKASNAPVATLDVDCVKVWGKRY